mgnify:CR=1 FL=1
MSGYVNVVAGQPITLGKIPQILAVGYGVQVMRVGHWTQEPAVAVAKVSSISRTVVVQSTHSTYVFLDGMCWVPANSGAARDPTRALISQELPLSSTFEGPVFYAGRSPVSQTLLQGYVSRRGMTSTTISVWGTSNNLVYATTSVATVDRSGTQARTVEFVRNVGSTLVQTTGQIDNISLDGIQIVRGKKVTNGEPCAVGPYGPPVIYVAGTINSDFYFKSCDLDLLYEGLPYVPSWGSVRVKNMRTAQVLDMEFSKVIGEDRKFNVDTKGTFYYGSANVQQHDQLIVIQSLA